MPKNYKNIAKKFADLGMSTIPIGQYKRPIGRWKEYSTHIPTEDDIKRMYSRKDAIHGIAVICGSVSGGLEVIDVDCKYDLTGTLFEDFMQFIADGDPELPKKLVVATTKSGGYHIYYRCDHPDGNKKLAQRYTTEEEKGENKNDRVRVLIETRGEGGYVVAAPTPKYAMLPGSKYNLIPNITEEERDVIWNAAIAMDETVSHVKKHNYSSYIDNTFQRFDKSPFDDYNERGVDHMVSVLKEAGWKIVRETGRRIYFLRPGNPKSQTSGDYHKELGLFSVFSTSTPFTPNKGYKPCYVLSKLKYNDDYKTTAKQLLKMGYGSTFKPLSRDVRKNIADKLKGGVSRTAIEKTLTAEQNLTRKDAKRFIERVESEMVADDDFWRYDGDKKKVVLVLHKFKDFLSRNGFGLYFYDPEITTYRLVRKVDNLVEESSTERMKKFVLEYLEKTDFTNREYTKEDVLEVILHNPNLFTNNILEYLEEVTIDFLRDDKDTSYIAFKNGIVVVTERSIELKRYRDIDKCVWKNELIDHKIDIEDDFDINKSEFTQFVRNISANDEERSLYAISILGYLAHKYKDPATPYAIILAEESADDKKGGGTGKGIFSKALEYILSSITIDGKQFKADKSFMFQRATLATRLIVLQDTRRKFDFETLYSVITEGITIERKNKDEIYIPYADSPKLLITTNHVIENDSQHAKRRQRVIEFSDNYGTEHTPQDDFGHRLFDDWDEVYWNNFYNAFFRYIQIYFKVGVGQMPETKTYIEKKIRRKFTDDFYDWFIDFIHEANILNREKMQRELYHNFLETYEKDKKEYSHKRFRTALEFACEQYGYEYKAYKSRSLGNKTVCVIYHKSDEETPIIRLNEGETEETTDYTETDNAISPEHEQFSQEHEDDDGNFF